MSHPARWLLIGPLPIERDVIGGTKVSFARLVASLRAAGELEVEVLNTSRPRGGRRHIGRALANAGALLRVLAGLARRLPRVDGVLFNVSSHGALRAGPLVWALCRLARKPLAVRLFGGDLDEVLDAAPRPLRALAERTFLRAPLVLLQTQRLCTALGARANTRWFPTTRELGAPARAPRGPARRFVFVGQLRPEKGLAEALAASDALPAEASLELFGPTMPGFDPASVTAYTHARYGGALAAADVPAVLAERDVLVFPSYHPGEGLPGVVVEALQCGLPVIAARWRAVPELVEDGTNGLLVEPRDEADLARALLRVARDEELYRRLAEGARTAGDRFRESTWSPRLSGWLRDLTHEDKEAA